MSLSSLFTCTCSQDDNDDTEVDNSVAWVPSAPPAAVHYPPPPPPPAPPRETTTLYPQSIPHGFIHHLGPEATANLHSGMMMVVGGDPRLQGMNTRPAKPMAHRGAAVVEDLDDTLHSSDTEELTDDDEREEGRDKGSDGQRILTPEETLKSIQFFNVGCRQQRLGDIEGAIKAYKEALLINDVYTSAHYNIATCYQLLKNTRGATYHYSQVLELDPKSTKALFNFGYLYLNDLKSPGRALELFQRCLELRPDDMDTRISIALATARMGETEAAIELYEGILKDSPYDNANVRMNIGNCFVELGNLEAAIPQYKKSLALTPKNVRCNFNLAAAYQGVAFAPNTTLARRHECLALARNCYLTIQLLLRNGAGSKDRQQIAELERDAQEGIDYIDQVLLQPGF